MKSWDWTIEPNSYTKSTPRLLAKKVFLQRRQFIPRPQNQESQRTKVNKKKNYSAIKTNYPRVSQTKKNSYDSRAAKQWAWTTELNSFKQSTLRLIAKRIFLQKSQFILRAQNQDSQRAKLNKKKKHLAFKTYHSGGYQTKNTYDSRAAKYWAWTTRSFFDKNRQFTLRWLNQELDGQNLRWTKGNIVWPPKQIGFLRI